MKVVCVNDGPDLTLAPIKPNGHVVKGESYTVVSQIALLGMIGYALAEKPVINPLLGENIYWDSRRFVPFDYYAAEFAVKETETQPSEQTV